jgi:trans-2,3-dihydro-3-hydroxyanthranilate isomerase
MELDYFVVDVFADTAFKGNPLAVVMNTCNLTADQMQAIAREFNLSETTFVERRDAGVEKREGVLVRIFTTQEELPFAGHPTLGTASVLRQNAPETVQKDTVTLALKVGAVPVRFLGAELFGEMTQRDPEFGEVLDAKEVARLCGLDKEDLDDALPPQIVSTGTAFAIVALDSHEALARFNVKHQEATAWLRARGARWFYVLAPTGSEEPAVQWRRRPGDWIGGGMRDQLPGETWCSGFGEASSLAPGCRDGAAERVVSVGRDTIGEGERRARRRQHCSCGKRKAFPALMHTLSTSDPQGK